jgi:hypothetical protein
VGSNGIASVICLPAGIGGITPIPADRLNVIRYARRHARETRALLRSGQLTTPPMIPLNWARPDRVRPPIARPPIAPPPIAPPPIAPPINLVLASDLVAELATEPSAEPSKDELEYSEFDPVQGSSKEVWAVVMCRVSAGAEDAATRRIMEQGQQVLIQRLAADWRASGINVTRICSCIRFRHSRDSIKEEFLDNRGNREELRLYNTLRNCVRAGYSMYIIQRGLDGITDRVSTISWLRY